MGSHIKEMLRRASSVLATAVVLLQVSMPATIAAWNDGDNNPPGNNGTLKVHEWGTPSGTESNDPKVCKFNFEGFGFDDDMRGYIVIDGQGQTAGTYGPYDFGPTNNNGYDDTQYFNDNDGPNIPNGQYKATLYGKKHSGGVDYNNEKAKSKVFKIECIPPVKTTVEVIKKVIGPANNNDTFDLYVNGDKEKDNASDSGTTGKVEIDEDDNLSIGEKPGNASVSLNNYATYIECKVGGVVIGSGNRTGSDSRTLTIDDNDIKKGDTIVCTITNTRNKPHKPADKVTKSETESEPDCDTKKVTITTTTITTPYVWDETSYTWKLGTPVVSSSTSLRNLTPDELKDCSKYPGDKIETGEWTDKEWECGDEKIKQFRIIKTTKYYWDGDEWKLKWWDVETKTEYQWRDLTNEERDMCEGSISGYKFDDRNFDGHWGWGENGIWGWKINLYAEKTCEVSDYSLASLSLLNDNQINYCDGWTKVSSTWTDVWGHYEFDDLEPGDYKVCEEQRFGWSQTFPAGDGCYYITISEGKHNDVYFRNFGNTKNGKLIVNKVVENSGETEETFDFNVWGWGVNKNFNNLGDGDSDHAYLSSGWYYVSELMGEGTEWDLASVNCGEAWVIQKENGVKVYVAPGAVVECTFVNKKKSIEVVATPLCPNGFPVLQFSVKANNFTPTQIKLTWLKSDGTSAGADADHVIEYTGSELNDLETDPGVYTDTINWVGSNPVLPDWPGYSLVNGQWVVDSSDLGGNLRPSAKLKFEVNPETTVDVDYPTDVNGCNPTNGQVLGTSTTTTLTNTGTSAVLAIVAALSLVSVASYVTLGRKRD